MCQNFYLLPPGKLLLTIVMITSFTIVSPSTILLISYSEHIFLEFFPTQTIRGIAAEMNSKATCTSNFDMVDIAAHDVFSK
jgi:hypothetical protein